MVKASIVIPTYHGAALVAETLASALAQTYQDFEVVIGDDASADNTLRVIETSNDPRLRILDDRSYAGPEIGTEFSLLPAGIMSGCGHKMICCIQTV